MNQDEEEMLYARAFMGRNVSSDFYILPVLNIAEGAVLDEALTASTTARAPARVVVLCWSLCGSSSSTSHCWFHLLRGMNKNFSHRANKNATATTTTINCTAPSTTQHEQEHDKVKNAFPPEARMKNSFLSAPTVRHDSICDHKK
ncbi:unnamed protein product, partial [Amoebophrya sp. A25]|eukprot:GSA25T00012149001.1